MKKPISAPVSAKPLQGSPWKIGANVPWSIAWTGEQVLNLQMSDDFPGFLEVVQVQNQGQGMPKFAAQHVTRHRMGMANHFCHVCGRRTLARDRYIFPVQVGGFVTMPDNSIRYAGNVPPVHFSCGQIARQLCPHLSHTYAQPVMYPSEASQLMPRRDVVPGMEEFAKTLQPELRVVFSCYRLYGPRFTKTVQKLRQDHASRVSDIPLV